MDGSFLIINPLLGIIFFRDTFEELISKGSSLTLILLPEKFSIFEILSGPFSLSIVKRKFFLVSDPNSTKTPQT